MENTGEKTDESRLLYRGPLAGLKDMLTTKVMSLVDRDSAAPEGGTTKIPIEFIHPNSEQPRQFFDPESLHELALTLENLGQAQAITVRRSTKGFEIISGERRFRAAKLAGLTHLECVVKECNAREARLLALVENTQRQDLLPIEEAQYLAKVVQENPELRLEALARTLGTHKSTLSEKIQLGEIPDTLQRHLYTKKGRYFTHRHWRVLSRIKEPEQLEKIFTQSIESQMSVLQLEKMLAEAGVPKVRRNRPQSQIDQAQESFPFPLISYRGDRVQVKAFGLSLRNSTEQVRSRVIAELEELLLRLRQAPDELQNLES